MFCSACGKQLPDDAVVCIGCGRAVQAAAQAGAPAYGDYASGAARDFASKKVVAGVCGILLGSLGIHKFILGLTTPGVIMLLVSVLTLGCGAIPMHVVGLVEGIIYLTKNDEEFYRTYGVEKRGWF
jgi:TM2 domain-containing membrane protein YozV